jgi:hypothetical protein
MTDEKRNAIDPDAAHDRIRELRARLREKSLTDFERTALRDELTNLRNGLAQWLAHGGYPPTTTNRSRKKGQPDG